MLYHHLCIFEVDKNGITTTNLQNEEIHQEFFDGLQVGVSQYIDISVYRNTRRIYIVSQYEIRIAIYRDFSFF